jgi:hypothetical protein
LFCATDLRRVCASLDWQRNETENETIDDRLVSGLVRRLSK